MDKYTLCRNKTPSDVRPQLQQIEYVKSTKLTKEKNLGTQKYANSVQVNLFTKLLITAQTKYLRLDTVGINGKYRFNNDVTGVQYSHFQQQK